MGIFGEFSVNFWRILGEFLVSFWRILGEFLVNFFVFYSEIWGEIGVKPENCHQTWTRTHRPLGKEGKNRKFGDFWIIFDEILRILE